MRKGISLSSWKAERMKASTMLCNGSQCRPLIRGDLDLCMRFQEFPFIAKQKDKNMTLRYYCGAQTACTYAYRWTIAYHRRENTMRVSFFFSHHYCRRDWISRLSASPISSSYADVFTQRVLSVVCWFISGRQTCFSAAITRNRARPAEYGLLSSPLITIKGGGGSRV